MGGATTAHLRMPLVDDDTQIVRFTGLPTGEVRATSRVGPTEVAFAESGVGQIEVAVATRVPVGDSATVGVGGVGGVAVSWGSAVGWSGVSATGGVVDSLDVASAAGEVSTGLAWTSGALGGGSRVREGVRIVEWVVRAGRRRLGRLG